MTGSGGKFVCPACGQESWLKTVTRYEGFTAVGEVETCALCGHEFAPGEAEVETEETPEFLRRSGPRRVCYLCVHYVVNPFVQKCVLHDREVEALDSCPRFAPKAPGTGNGGSPGGTRGPGLSIFGD